MKIAVASGKGGTGKTTVSVSLALAAPGKVQYVDCDVEEPNGHLFLNPVIGANREVHLSVPRVIEEQCSYCGKCRDLCRFKAITVFGRTIMAFADLCHSCGGCFLVCPEKALAREKRLVGVVEKGDADGVAFVHGLLRVGEAMAVPLIRAVKEECAADGLVIVDAPPGTSCPLVATIKDCDYALLVTEATPFGLHDLQLAVGVLRKLERPFGVIINRADMGDKGTERWCAQEDIKVHMQIPFDRKIAEGYAAGEPLIVSRPDLRDSFALLLEELQP
ncbi:MAG: ATP-binding protein [Proteobacteria bacterium]|nr:ATP-binding protein [Pseudomonadota bacterium]MBU0968006.1 ATP-binding protein [Pseudomonadota bacterium]